MFGVGGQGNILHERSSFRCEAATFDNEILNQRHTVTSVKNCAIAVNSDLRCVFVKRRGGTSRTSPRQNVFFKIKTFQKIHRPAFRFQSVQHAPCDHLNGRDRAPHAVVQASPMIGFCGGWVFKLTAAGFTHHHTIVCSTVTFRRHFVNRERCS